MHPRVEPLVLERAVEAIRRHAPAQHEALVSALVLELRIETEAMIDTDVAITANALVAAQGRVRAMSDLLTRVEQAAARIARVEAPTPTR